MRHDDTKEPLSTEDCWRLIATQSVGRLALSLHALPAILPVQYYLDGKLIAICLGHHRVPRQSISDAVAAFAVDHLCDPRSEGWTVHVQGIVEPPRPLGVPADCGQPDAGQIVHLRPETITGQRVWLCPVAAPMPMPPSAETT